LIQRIKALSIAVAVALTQYGCGSGEVDMVRSAPLADYQGFYTNTEPDGSILSTAIFDDGSLYAISFDKEGKEFHALRGTVEGSNGNLFASDIIDYSFNGLGPVRGQLSGTYRAKQSLSGQVTYSETGRTMPVSVTYDPRYEDTPTLANAAGVYSGLAVGESERGQANVSITPQGTVEVSGPNDCRAAGEITPKKTGNAYDITVRYDQIASCSLSGQVMTGSVVIEAETGHLNALATSADRTHPLLFTGGK
jgi:hypothetical protein